MSTPKPNFWKPNTAPPPTGSSLDRSSESTPLLTPAASTSTHPISSQRLSILYALETSQVVIVISGPGSAQTTHLASLLYTSGYASPCIACTQPRPAAATAAAAHVASSLGVPLGQEVGYSVRFETHTSPWTRVKHLTDETLFDELVRDPLLTNYSVVIVDGVHERGVYTDLLLGVLKKVCRKRRELRVVVVGAGEAEVLSGFFDGAKVVRLESGSYPVDVAYLVEPTDDYVETTVDTVQRIHVAYPPGDVLAFLTSRQEVHAALQSLADLQADLPDGAPKMHLLELHAGLSASEQAEILAPSPPGMRKVVLATSVAETRLALLPSDGVAYVVDCGFVQLRYNDTSVRVPTSRALAEQRAQRAGGCSRGRCFRLYTEECFRRLPSATPAEMNRVDVSGAVLALKSVGIDDVVRFEWVPPAPAPEALAAALRRLVQLKAVDEHARLTQVGAWMGEIPLAPRLARVLVASTEPQYACAAEMLSIIAMQQIAHPFAAAQSVETQLSVRCFAAQEGDMLTAVNVYNAFVGAGKGGAKWCRKHRVNFAALSRAVSIRNQLDKFLRRFELPVESVLGRPDAVERISRCLITGLCANLARYDDVTMTYRDAADEEKGVMYAHPTSVFFNRRPGKSWVVYGEKTQEADGDKTYVRDLMSVELDWVVEGVPGVYDVSTKWGGGRRGAQRGGDGDGDGEANL